MKFDEKKVDEFIERIKSKNLGHSSLFIKGSDFRLRKFHMINFAKVWLDCKSFFFDYYDRPYNILHHYQGQDVIVFVDYIPDLTSILFMIKISLHLHKKDKQFPLTNLVEDYIKQNKNYNFKDYDFSNLKMLCILSTMKPIKYFSEAIVKNSIYLGREICEKANHIGKKQCSQLLTSLLLLTCSAFPNYHEIINSNQVIDHRFKHDDCTYYKKMNWNIDLEAIAKDYEEIIKEERLRKHDIN